MVVPRFGFDPFNTVDFGVSVAVLVPLWNKKERKKTKSNIKYINKIIAYNKINNIFYN